MRPGLAIGVVSGVGLFFVPRPVATRYVPLIQMVLRPAGEVWMARESAERNG
jgi:hypothetical protein